MNSPLFYYIYSICLLSFIKNSLKSFQSKAGLKQIREFNNRFIKTFLKKKKKVFFLNKIKIKSKKSKKNLKLFLQCKQNKIYLLNTTSKYLLKLLNTNKSHLQRPLNIRRYHRSLSPLKQLSQLSKAIILFQSSYFPI